MVENIVRHMTLRQDASKTTLEVIRKAAHEVQRPVFYAIGIIITAYLPVFTLQRVEGRLFKPMAWTVAFALLGALYIFHGELLPCLASLPSCPKVTRRNGAIRGNEILEKEISSCRKAGNRPSLGDRRSIGAWLGLRRVSDSELV